MHNLIISADKRLKSYEDLRSDFLNYTYKYNIPVSDIAIISGSDSFADVMIAELAREFNLKYTAYETDWETYGTRAGFVKCEKMAEDADGLLAIWDGYSFETGQLIKLAENGFEQYSTIEKEGISLYSTAGGRNEQLSQHQRHIYEMQQEDPNIKAMQDAIDTRDIAITPDIRKLMWRDKVTKLADEGLENIALSEQETAILNNFRSLGDGEQSDREILRNIKSISRRDEVSRLDAQEMQNYRLTREDSYLINEYVNRYVSAVDNLSPQDREQFEINDKDRWILEDYINNSVGTPGRQGIKEGEKEAIAPGDDERVMLSKFRESMPHDNHDEYRIRRLRDIISRDEILSLTEEEIESLRLTENEENTLREYRDMPYLGENGASSAGTGNASYPIEIKLFVPEETEQLENNIFTQGTQAIVNPVNCVGVMGAGLAKQFRENYPDYYKAYRAQCENGYLDLGKVWVYEAGSAKLGRQKEDAAKQLENLKAKYKGNQKMTPEDIKRAKELEDILSSTGKIIISFPTKYDWQDKSSINDISKGLDDLAAKIKQHGIKSIAIPALGAGLGGLKETDVEILIKSKLRNIDNLEVKYCKPKKQPFRKREAAEDWDDSSDILMLRGEHFFLSNFYKAPIKVDGFKFGSAEQAFQFFKCKDGDFNKVKILNAKSPLEAKKLGSNCDIREDWEQESAEEGMLVKDAIMYKIVRAKFEQNPQLAEKLFETGNRNIMEGNYWKDDYWGIYKGKGKNMLGNILMSVRETLALNREADIDIALSSARNAIRNNIKSGFYAGIGSRETPDEALAVIKQLGEYCCAKGLTLRSGGAVGADSAFEYGCDTINPAKKEVLIPWNGFNEIYDNGSTFITPAGGQKEKMTLIASMLHPKWSKCSDGAKKMHTRNVGQILGMNLDKPADFVICWTPDGEGGGGTGQALRIAGRLKIPILDLGGFDDMELAKNEAIKFIDKHASKEKELTKEAKPKSKTDRADEIINFSGKRSAKSKNSDKPRNDIKNNKNIE